jgi:tetratricopeptide (TPR) repeat protein
MVTPGTPAPGLGPLLSLAMIVRDAATDLPRCLDSARGMVDEMVVVDTGSADATCEVATAAGARVHEIPWQDDFAAARNASLDLCLGRWILVLDADEIFASASRGPLRAWVQMRDGADARVALSLDTRNYQPDGVWRRGWQRVPDRDPHGLPGGPPSLGFVTSRKVRLFRRDPAIRFRGCLHETVEASLDEAGVEIQTTDIPVHHLGSLRQDPAKQLRYRQLAGRKVREAPNDPGAWAELAEACHLDGDRRAALEAIDQAVRLSCGRADYALTAGLLWLEAGAPGRAETLLHLAAGSSRLAGPQRAEALHALARAALHRGRLQLAGDLLDTALRLAPHDGQIWNTLGVLAVHDRRGPDAAAALKRATELRPGDVSPLLNLGILYDEARQPEPAIRYLRLALARDPDCAEAWRRLERLSQDL